MGTVESPGSQAFFNSNSRQPWSRNATPMDGPDVDLLRFSRTSHDWPLMVFHYRSILDIPLAIPIHHRLDSIVWNRWRVDSNDGF